jgi:hypothetical protein
MTQERTSGTSRGLVWLCAFSFAALAACGSRETQSAPPTTFAFSIDFQSKEAAISADTVHIEVFDPQTSCSSLTLKRASGSTLPTPVAQLDPVSVCDLVTSKAGTVAVPYGTFSVLVVATRGGQDWLIGCGVEHIGVQTGEPPVITLSNFDNQVQIPTTTCPDVTAHCMQQCT